MPSVDRPTRALAASVAVLALVGTLAGCASDPDFSAELETFEGAHAVKNEVVDLPGGDRFSAGSPDGHDVVVQRYDAEAGGWSSPTTIHTETDLWTHALTVSHAGSTVAVDVDYWDEEVLDDDHAPQVTVGAVCPDAACTPGVSSGEQLTSVSLAEDGGSAAFRGADGQWVRWTGGHEWSPVDLGPLPDGADVGLAPDGSFVAATGRRDGGSCVYTLLTTEPSGSGLVERATATGPFDGDDCDAVLDEVTDDRVALWVEETAGTVEFVRDDGSSGAWEAAAPPPSYDTVRDTGGRSTLAPVFARSGPDRVVLYSPDLRTLWTQTWTVYTGVWTEPQQVATLPDGVHCRRGRILEVREGNGFYAAIGCFTSEDDGLDPAALPPTTLALRSWNGTGWLGGLVEDAGRFTDTGSGFLVAGDPAVLVDMETGEATEVPLPFPEPRTDPVVASSDGWVLRVAPREVGGRCVATVHAAGSPQDDQWTDGVSFPVPDRAGACPRLEATLRPDLRVVVGDGHGWRVVLKEAADGWRVAG